MTGSLHIGQEFINKAEGMSIHIGNTPMLKIESLSSEKTQVYAKAEWSQFGGSVKSRAAYQIIYQALKRGLLQGKTLLDASSGNTAIAYATICSKLQIPVEICLPKNASQKRKQILKALGAKLHLTSEFEGTDGAQEIARKMYSENRNDYYYADQYNNDANWQAHYYGTAEELWKQTNKRITHFVSALGTTGSFSGTSLRLKEYNPKIKTVALQPDSPMHILEGWKHLETAKIPGIFKENLVDEYLQISSMDSIDMIKKIAHQEGLLISPSSAANLVGAKKLAEKIDHGIIVTLLPDDLSKYDEILNEIL